MAVKHRSMFLLVLAGTALPAIPAAALEAPIRAVTLYPGSATVERVAQVAQGATRIEITGLQANFDTGTVRVQADAGIQVGQVVTRDLGQADNPSPRSACIRASSSAMRDQIARVETEVKSAQMVVSYLESLKGGESTVPAAPNDPKALLGTIDVIRKGASDALNRKHDGDVRIRALQEQLAVLAGERAKRQAVSRDGRVMTISVAARQAGTLTLSYQVDRAGWKPAYRASLDSAASSVDLERLATISQKSGEDWSNVRLRLSTGQPRLTVDVPDPAPWLLRYQPPAPPAPPPPPAPAPSAFARSAPPDMRYLRPSTGAERDDYIAPVIENQGNFSTEFEVPAPVDLAADGREISVGLGSQRLAVRQSVQVAPRTGDAAVLIAQAPRPGGVWLPGQVQLRRDGSYVGALQWNPAAQDQFSIAFGRDPLVRVTVEDRGQESGQTGFFRRASQRRIAHTYVVTSAHRQPIDLLVLEATPVSDASQVTVKATLKPEPGIKDWMGRRGLVGWQRTLGPGETARFDTDYLIDYPQEGTVDGLP